MIDQFIAFHDVMVWEGGKCRTSIRASTKMRDLATRMVNEGTCQMIEVSVVQLRPQNIHCVGEPHNSCFNSDILRIFGFIIAAAKTKPNAPQIPIASKISRHSTKSFRSKPDISPRTLSNRLAMVVLENSDLTLFLPLRPSVSISLGLNSTNTFLITSVH